MLKELNCNCEIIKNFSPLLRLIKDIKRFWAIWKQPKKCSKNGEMITTNNDHIHRWET